MTLQARANSEFERQDRLADLPASVSNRAIQIRHRLEVEVVVNVEVSSLSVSWKNESQVGGSRREEAGTFAASRCIDRMLPKHSSPRRCIVQIRGSQFDITSKTWNHNCR